MLSSIKTKYLVVYTAYCLLLLGLPQRICAQMTIPIPQSSTVNTPYGSFSHTTYINHTIPTGSEVPRTYRGQYWVFTKAGDTLHVNGKILLGQKQKLSYKIHKEKRSISPEQTKGIVSISQNGRLTGIPADTCWLFPTRRGPITEYSFLPSPNTEFVTAIKHHSSDTLVALNEENLKAIMKDEPPLIALIERGRWVKAIRKYNQAYGNLGAD